MDAAVKVKWIEALRSGKWTQATGVLSSGDGGNGRCCLGVLCEVYAAEHPLEVHPFSWMNCLDTAILPDEVLVWGGLRVEEIPSVKTTGIAEVARESYGDRVSVSSLNDWRGDPASAYPTFSFEDIASLIERDL